MPFAENPTLILLTPRIECYFVTLDTFAFLDIAILQDQLMEFVFVRNQCKNECPAFSEIF